MARHLRHPVLVHERNTPALIGQARWNRISSATAGFVDGVGLAEDGEDPR